MINVALWFCIFFFLFLKPSFYCITYIFVLFLYFPLKFSFTPTILFIICVIKDIGRKKERWLDRKENYKERRRKKKLKQDFWTCFFFIIIACHAYFHILAWLVAGLTTSPIIIHTHTHTYMYMHSPIAS